MEKRLAKHFSKTGLVSRMYVKNSPNSDKIDNWPIKEWEKIRTDASPERGCWALSTGKATSEVITETQTQTTTRYRGTSVRRAHVTEAWQLRVLAKVRSRGGFHSLLEGMQGVQPGWKTVRQLLTKSSLRVAPHSWVSTGKGRKASVCTETCPTLQTTQVPSSW